MSESKAEYYAKHLEQQQDETRDWLWCDTCRSFHHPTKVHSPEVDVPGGNVILGPNEQMEMVQPTGLPTLLARMVTEFQVGLGDQSTEVHEMLVRTFTADLLSAAQPILTEYLNKLANPPMVVKKQDDEAGLPIMVRAVLAAERQRAEEALALVRAGKGVPAARKHLGLE